MPIIAPISRDERRLMQKAIHKTHDKNYARRLTAMLMLHRGDRVSDVARTLCCARSSVGRSYDLCQILSPKRPYAAPGASLYRGLKNLKQSDCILDFTNSYSGILAP